MRDHDFSGWHHADDIGAFYAWFCDEEAFLELTDEVFREHFAAAPGVTRVRRRLTSATDKQLVRIRRRLKPTDRPVLYRIDSHEELAEARDRRAAKRAQSAGRSAGESAGQKSAEAAVAAPVKKAA